MAHHCTVEEGTVLGVVFGHAIGGRLKRVPEWRVTCDKCGLITKRGSQREAQSSADRHAENPLTFMYG